jgi:hypothetical protein
MIDDVLVAAVSETPLLYRSPDSTYEHVAIFKCDPANITSIASYSSNSAQILSDITKIIGIPQCVNLATLNLNYNRNLPFNIMTVPASIVSLNVAGCSLVTGSVEIYLPLATNIQHWRSPLLTGDLNNQTSPNVSAIDIGGDSLVTATGVSGIPDAIHFIGVNIMGWNATAVDVVLGAIYTSRARFTDATHYFTIATNAAPGGAYTNPATAPGDGNSNSDWSWDGTKHVPLSGMAKVYYLRNGPDHGTDSFVHWTIYADGC